MRLNKPYNIMIGLLIGAVIALFMVSCDQSPTDMGTAEDSSNLVAAKAGTNFQIANIFDLDGLSVPGPNTVQSIGDPMQLWMGVGNITAGVVIGTVEFLTGPDRVVLHLNDPGFYPYVGLEAHIHFADTVEGIPQTKKGNPVVGHFDYNVELDPGELDPVINITGGFKSVGAIHVSTIYYGGMAGIDFYLPENPVNVSIVDVMTENAYIQFNLANAGIFDGTYNGWCVDADNSISNGDEYCARLFSSYNVPQVVVDMLDNEQNFGSVNWLINNYLPGDTVGERVITYGDLQYAMWLLIDKLPANLKSLGDYDVPTAEILYNQALAHNDFVPGCDQKIVFIVVPVDCSTGEFLEDGGFQLVIGDYPVPCDNIGGTAWGDGKYGATFPGNQWGTWFKMENY